MTYQDCHMDIMLGRISSMHYCSSDGSAKGKKHRHVFSGRLLLLLVSFRVPGPSSSRSCVDKAAGLQSSFTITGRFKVMCKLLIATWAC